MAPGSVRRTSTSTVMEGLVEGRTPLVSASSLCTQHNNVGSSFRAVRGVTKGKHTARLIKHNGGNKLPVIVPEETQVPVGENATKVANELGVQIRLAAPLQGVKRWDQINPAARASIIQAARDKFEIEDYDKSTIVQKAIQKKCSLLYKDWKSKMKRHYLKLLEAGVDPYSAPYHEVRQGDWTYMINHVWQEETHKKRSAQNKENRSKLLYNHTMGSRSFPAGMSIKPSTPGGEVRHFVDFYKTAHWSKKKNDWIEPICGELHDEMERRHEESLQPGATPITQENISVMVLGDKPGYLKGFGVGPKPSSSSKYTQVSQAPNQEEVQSLKTEIESLRELTQSQQEKIEEQSKRFEELESVIWHQVEMMKVMTNRGGGNSSTGC